MPVVDTDGLQARLKRRIDELPVLPTVVAGLMTLDRDAEDYFESVLELLEADPTYSARVLAAANSAASAPREPVSAVRSALARLGTSGASDLILAMAVSSVFIPRDDWERSLWRHALQVAGAMRKLAPLTPDRFAMNPDEAYAAGLLHDVGRFVLMGEAPETLRRIDEGSWDGHQELVDLERSICGLDHGEIGQLACAHWGLPELLGDVARRHHERVDPAEGKVAAMVSVAHFADLAMFPSAMPGTPGYDDADVSVIEAELVPKLPDGVDVTAAKLQDIITSVTADVDETCRQLGIA